MQRHVYDKSQPEALKFAETFRSLINQYSDVMTLAEIGDDNAMKMAAEYTSGNNKYSTAYNFSLMVGDTVSASLIKNAVEDFFNQPFDGWPSWAFCNHDVIRVASRWGEKHGYDENPEFAKMLLALLCSLKGTIFLYQGEELGLTEAKIPFEKLQDPWGKYLWPEWQGRDGCRTPMPWDENDVNLGFSSAEETWLPIADDHRARTIQMQDKTANSPLNFARSFLKWRKEQTALTNGEITFVDKNDENVLCFERESKDQTMVCYFNLSSQVKTVSLDEVHAKTEAALNTGNIGHTENSTKNSSENAQLILPAFGIYYGLIS